jgi:hypothetical protein
MLAWTGVLSTEVAGPEFLVQPVRPVCICQACRHAEVSPVLDAQADSGTKSLFISEQSLERPQRTGARVPASQPPETTYESSLISCDATLGGNCSAILAAKRSLIGLRAFIAAPSRRLALVSSRHWRSWPGQRLARTARAMVTCA